MKNGVLCGMAQIGVRMPPVNCRFQAHSLQADRRPLASRSWVGVVIPPLAWVVAVPVADYPDCSETFGVLRAADGDLELGVSCLNHKNSADTFAV